MVLLCTTNLTKRNGVCKGQVLNGHKIEHHNKITLRKIFFNLCKGCQLEIMASIPPSAFSAGRIRQTQHDMKLSNTNKRAESKKFFTETSVTELSPLKYNSKLMNSIWGLYNRYSPHNVKKVNDAFVYNAELQQSAVNSNNKTESMISLSAKLDNLWASINLTPSH